jgi:hypothetical protein
MVRIVKKKIAELETQLQPLEGERKELLAYRQQAEREQQLRRWSHLRQDELITFFKQALGYELSPTQASPANSGPVSYPPEANRSERHLLLLAAAA